ncbi:MAG: efflux transporter outer membrane subunit [Candidatus Pelagadaptatus aseana]
MASGLTGCALNEPPEAQDALTQALPEQTQIAGQWQAADDVGAVTNNWLQTFNDPHLTAMVDEVIANNPNLQAASAQVEVAAGLARQAGSQLKPTIGLGAGASSADGSGIAGTLDSSNAFLNVSWELDIWGRVRAGVAAAESALQASEADYQSARQSLAATTAKAWFLATQIHVQKELAEEAVEIYTDLVKLVTAKEQVGKAQPQDLPLAKARLAGAEANLRLVNSSYQEILRSIEVLLGRYPSAELKTVSDFAAFPPPVPAGLPSQILERRPDLRAAEQRVSAAFYGVQQAEAARLPRISLTAIGGAADNGLLDLLNIGNPIGQLGASLFAPLYTGGALEAGVDIADAQKRGAMALYAQAALQAFREVETALANEQLYAERQIYQREVVNKSQEAFRITKAQYQVGRLDLLTVLQTQASLIGAKSDLAAITNDRLSQRVSLHLALGGSFDSQPASGPTSNENRGTN